MGIAALRDRYLVVGFSALIAFVSVVAIAYAVPHYMNGLHHGLAENQVPMALVGGPSTNISRVEVRHYSPDGSWNRQCGDESTGLAVCNGTSWGSLPCQKRAVTGTEGIMARHWQRASARFSCAGSLHGF